MLRESITWATVATLASTAIKDRQFLANLIKSHKSGTAVLPATSPLNQELTKRPNGHITPNEGDPVVFPGWANSSVKQRLYTETEEASKLLPNSIDAQASTVAAVNNMEENKFQSTTWVQLNIVTTREVNWIHTKSKGISSYYVNPRKAIHTMFNWHTIAVSDNDLNIIKYISTPSSSRNC